MNKFQFSSLLDFSVADFFSNAKNFAIDISTYVIVICGIILIVVAVYRIAEGLMHGGRGTNWTMAIMCLVGGGVLGIGGYTYLQKFGKDMLENELTNRGLIGAGSGGGVIPPVAGGTMGGIDLSQFFDAIGDNVGAVASGIASIAGVILIGAGCVQLMKLLSKPRPAPLPIWLWAVLTLCVGGLIESGWWIDDDSSALTANGWATAIQSTISDVGSGSYGGGSGTTSINVGTEVTLS